MIGLMLLAAMQAEQFEGLFKHERGSIWTYSWIQEKKETRVTLTLLKKEPRKLILDEKEGNDPRATTVTLSIADGFLLFERRVDDELHATLRLLKLDSKPGEKWEGGERLENDGETIRVKVAGAEFWLDPAKGASRIEAPGKKTTLTSITRPACTPIPLTGTYNASLTRAWHPPGLQEAEFNDLAELPRGIQTLDGTPFDCRGVLQLAGNFVRGKFPDQVDIDVAGPAAKLHILHACGWAAAPAAPIAAFTVHYRDGTTAEIPVEYGTDVGDWWQYPHSPFAGTRGKAVWTGSNPAARTLGATLKLYKTTWDNPKPALDIARLTYKSHLTDAAPFLVALTAEREKK